MAERPIVVLHGWHDEGDSFRPLAALIRKRLGKPVRPVNLADYVTMDDAVTYDDLVEALESAWSDQGLPTEPGSVDAVVHSTGALVIRDWLVRRRMAPNGPPVKRLLMLAPANFGSPLAHKGRTFLGRALFGWNADKPFQTGTQVLRGLELASPYQWDLAARDRFGAADLYGPGRILCTVLVGNAGFDGIRAVANEDGSDGTVRVSTAGMECALLEADFDATPKKPTFEIRTSRGATAFRVLENENHSTVAAKDKGPRNGETAECIARALTVGDDGFEAWRKECAAATGKAMVRGRRDPATHGFQNTVFLVEDQYGRRVREYLMEFFVHDDDRDLFAAFFHEEVVRDVHVNGEDPALRAVLMDCTALRGQADRPGKGLRISLTASPEIRRTGSVGYRTYTDADIGAIEIPWDALGGVFAENRTLLFRLRLKRYQKPGVFRFKRAKL
jgi:hypothetical protein